MPMAFSEHNKAVSGYICAQEIMICIVLIRLHFLLPCKQVMKGYVKHLSYTHPNWTQAKPMGFAFSPNSVSDHRNGRRCDPGN